MSSQNPASTKSTSRELPQRRSKRQRCQLHVCPFNGERPRRIGRVWHRIVDQSSIFVLERHRAMGDPKLIAFSSFFLENEQQPMSTTASSRGWFGSKPSSPLPAQRESTRLEPQYPPALHLTPLLHYIILNQTARVSIPSHIEPDESTHRSKEGFGNKSGSRVKLLLN